MKTIIFIPPNGKLKKHDFSIQRVAKSLRENKKFRTILLYIKNEQEESYFDYFDEIVAVSSEKELFKTLSKIDYNTIFSRSWMHAYPFSAKLVKKFDNVIVNIKDWNFSTKEEYKFLFGNDDDFDAIEYIFKNANYVLSHYTIEQAEIWAKEYNVDKDKFIFYPEYCTNLSNSIPKERDKYKILFAGTFGPTSNSERFFVSKDMYKTLKCITEQSLYLDYIFPPSFYDALDRMKYQDFLTESEFNKHFNLKRGKELDADTISCYGYGIFCPIINNYRYPALFEYAVPSKLAFYLDANLPMIVNKKMKALANIVKSNGLGVVVSNEDMNNIKNIIQDLDYDTMLNNIIKFKKKFSYEYNSLVYLLDKNI